MGVCKFYRTDNQGIVRKPLRKYTNSRRSCSITMPGQDRDGKYSVVLFYGPTEGVGEFCS